MSSCAHTSPGECITCPKAKKQVRFFLGLFAVTNFCTGMAFFMFLLCSSSETHRDHLLHMFGVHSSDHVHKSGNLR